MTVGKRQPDSRSPEEAVQKAIVLIAAAEQLAGQKRPRHFVVKAPTRAAYEQWKRAQSYPGFW